MKIKEVIKETGLTDRAIRLYMENDRIKPEYDENYNGRKSIDFSENDVVQLKNIATLRKADFSIQEIKSLQSGGETAQQIVKDYIKRTNEKIHFNTEIIVKIGTLADEKNITIEIICEKLSNNLADEKVPVEDMELSPKEQKEKTIFTAISVIGMIMSGAIMLLIIIIVISLDYRYTTLAPYDLPLIHKVILFPFKYCFFVQFVLCLGLFLLYKKNIKIIRKKALRIFIIVLLVISLLLSPLAFSVHFFGYSSETTNPNNYLEVDEKHMLYEWDDIFQVFPYKMPDSVKQLVYNKNATTKYYYSYSDDFLNAFHMDIYAEWQLEHDTESIYGSEYEKEKQRILSKDNIVSIEPMGDWQCVYIMNIEEDADVMLDYIYLFFAYNDKTHTVRYIAEYGYKDSPYHLKLEW